MSQTVRIGKIVGCHGIRGELKVRPNETYPTQAIPPWARHGMVLKLVAKPNSNQSSGTEQQVKIESSRWQKEMVLLKLEGYPDRTAAEALIGGVLFASPDTLPDPNEDEFWVHDLIGLSVLDRYTKDVRGIVQDVLTAGGQIFLEIRLPESGETTVVVPFIESFFPEVSVADQRILLQFPGDLRELGG